MKFLKNKTMYILVFSIALIILASIYFFTHDSNEVILTNTTSLTENYIYHPNTDETTEKIAIHITGEVNSPGVVYIPAKSRIIDAIKFADGLTESADTNKVNLVYELKDGQKIYIPSIYDENTSEYISDDAGNNVLDDSSNNSVININSADKKVLESLPGIGSSIANRIIEYRAQNGSFKSIDEIMNIPGIGENKFNIIKDFISI